MPKSKKLSTRAHLRTTMLPALLALLMLLAFCPVQANAAADEDLSIPDLAAAGSLARAQADTDVPILYPGNTQILTSNVLLGARGTYEATSSEKLLKRINEIRKEAYDEGLASAYVPIKWSDALEYIAQIRSVEASVKQAHERPKGGYMFVMQVNGVMSYAEDLAWGGDALDAVEMWYSEKADLVNNTGRETGHYTSMIDPAYTYIGIGSFQRKGSWNTVAAEFTYGSGLNEGRTNINGDCIQLIEVPKADASVKITGPGKVAIGHTGAYKATGSYDGISMELPGAYWTISDETIATATDDGTASTVLTGTAAGDVTLTAEIRYGNTAGGMTATKDITVTETAAPAATSITKLTKGKKSFAVKWDAVKENATGYEVQYSLKKNFSGAKTKTVGSGKTTLKVSKLKAKKTYYVRVRAFGEGGHSDWSKVRTVKTK